MGSGRPTRPSARETSFLASRARGVSITLPKVRCGCRKSQIPSMSSVAMAQKEGTGIVFSHSTLRAPGRDPPVKSGGAELRRPRTKPRGSTLSIEIRGETGEEDGERERARGGWQPTWTVDWAQRRQRRGAGTMLVKAWRRAKRRPDVSASMKETSGITIMNGGFRGVVTKEDLKAEKCNAWRWGRADRILPGRGTGSRVQSGRLS